MRALHGRVREGGIDRAAELLDDLGRRAFRTPKPCQLVAS
jgi:hypothetical protein